MHPAGWRAILSLLPRRLVYRAIGWVIMEDKHRLCIAGRVPIADGKDSTTRQYIVKSCIVKRKKVKLPMSLHPSTFDYLKPREGQIEVMNALARVHQRIRRTHLIKPSTMVRTRRISCDAYVKQPCGSMLSDQASRRIAHDEP